MPLRCAQGPERYYFGSWPRLPYESPSAEGRGLSCSHHLGTPARGRKPGQGTFRRHAVLPVVDREVVDRKVVAVAEFVSGCRVVLETVAAQWQTELPVTRVVTRFTVEIGRWLVHACRSN